MEEYLSECKSMISECKDDIKQTLIGRISTDFRREIYVIGR